MWSCILHQTGPSEFMELQGRDGCVQRWFTERGGAGARISATVCCLGATTGFRLWGALPHMQRVNGEDTISYKVINGGFIPVTENVIFSESSLRYDFGFFTCALSLCLGR